MATNAFPGYPITSTIFERVLKISAYECYPKSLAHYFGPPCAAHLGFTNLSRSGGSEYFQLVSWKVGVLFLSCLDGSR